MVVVGVVVAGWIDLRSAFRSFLSCAFSAARAAKSAAPYAGAGTGIGATTVAADA